MGLFEIQAKRLKWIYANRENGFEDGINRLLTDLYPDNAHFIYELLQNAEDAKASKVRFELKEDHLKFMHNGSRLFDEKDIESITNIGNSTKRDDVNSIGKFGVGFKAVFSYTIAPKIYSGKHSFEIKDLVIPCEIDGIQKGDDETVMLFAFNNPKKPKERAYEEISKAFVSMSDTALLFLNNIHRIEFESSFVSDFIQRDEVDKNRFEISRGSGEEKTEWLVFKRYFEESKGLYSAVAYALKRESNDRYHIAPTEGSVCIYFPAEKEVSKLRFHIHAPFASTVARDSVKNIEENRKIISHIAGTVSDSFGFVFENDLLDFSFLEVLPNNDDNLSDFYKPIQQKIISIFRNTPLLATESGSCTDAKSACIGSARLKKLISDEELSNFLREPNLSWIKNPLKNTRADKFISSLGVKEFKDEEFVKSLSYLDDEDDIKHFFDPKNDEWYQSFYSMMSDLYDDHDYILNDFKKFVRLSDNSVNIEEINCYLPSGSLSCDSQHKFVKEETYTYGNNKKEQEKALGFLKKIGIKEIDEEEKIKILLKNSFNDDNPEDIEKHIYHISTILKYYEYDSISAKDVLSSERFVLDKSNSFNYPSRIYIDVPFENTGLSVLEEIDSEIPWLHDSYRVLDDEQKRVFLKMLRKLGGNFGLKIQQTAINNTNFSNRSSDFNALKRDLRNGKREIFSSMISIDWVMPHAKEILELNSVKGSLLIWNTMKEMFEKRHKDAVYKANQKCDAKYADSTVVYLLKTTEWIPDKMGVFRRPANISQDMLPDDFVYDNRNGWLDAIGFGEEIRKNQQEYKEIEKISKEKFGHSPEVLEKLKEFSEEDINKFLNLLEKEKKKSADNYTQPALLESIESHERSVAKLDRQTPNPAVIKDENKYIEAVNRQLDEILKSTPKLRVSTAFTKTKHGRDDVNIFLQEQYKDHCQICGFSFEVKSGNCCEILDWHSEKITKTKSDVVLDGGALLLCPNCHAMIKKGSFSPSFLKNCDINSLDGFKKISDDFLDEEFIPECFRASKMYLLKLPIEMNREKRYIFYTEEHFLRFYSLLKLDSINDKEQQ